MKQKIVQFSKRIFGIEKVQSALRTYTRKQQFKMRCERLIEHILHDTEKGISSERYTDHDIIVSLTTFGKRINDVAFTIESIMQQSVKANRIILWLDYSFEHKRLPQSLINQQKRGLEIAFCEDIRSYKKIIPTLIHFPDDAIITVDDDVLYDYDLLERLVFAYLSDPKYIYCSRYHRMGIKSNGKIAPYNSWLWGHNDESPSHLNFATGIGGVLYPPHAFDEEVLNEEVFLDICKFADDVWLKAMAVKKGIMVKKVYTRDKGCNEYLLNEDVQDIGLRNINTRGDNLNDSQLKAVFSKYDLYKDLQHK